LKTFLQFLTEKSSVVDYYEKNPDKIKDISVLGVGSAIKYFGTDWIDMVTKKQAGYIELEETINSLYKSNFQELKTFNELINQELATKYSTNTVLFSSVDSGNNTNYYIGKLDIIEKYINSKILDEKDIAILTVSVVALLRIRWKYVLLSSSIKMLEDLNKELTEGKANETLN